MLRAWVLSAQQRGRVVEAWGPAWSISMPSVWCVGVRGAMTHQRSTACVSTTENSQDEDLRFGCVDHGWARDHALTQEQDTRVKRRVYSRRCRM